MIVDGYVRVSQVAGREGPSFMSPDMQREHIERWAKMEGALIAHVYEELDESGGRKDRPLLLKAITRVERGESEGLVVAWANRFARSQLDGLIAIDRIIKAGGVFVAAAEGLDYSSDMGRHMVREMLSWAEYELDRVRSTWAAVRERAVARGVSMGPPPAGYRKRSDGRLAVDPVAGPVISEVFRRRAAGVRVRDLEEFLSGSGAKTWHGNTLWSTKSVIQLLANRAYLGEVRHGEFVKHKAHPALVDEVTWRMAQSTRAGSPLPATTYQAALLRGILRCAGCRRLLRAGLRNRGSSSETQQYQCVLRESWDSCPARVQIQGSVVEPFVEALFWQELGRARRRTGTAPLRRLEVELARREHELHAYRDNARLIVTLGPERFAAGLAIRSRRLDEALVQLGRAREASKVSQLPSKAELQDGWSEMGVGERRSAIAKVIQCVFVSPARRGASVDERLFACLQGRAPADLPPYRADRRLPTTPFDPGTCPPPARLRGRDENCTHAQLHAALSSFLDRRVCWPSFTEFQAAGLAELYVHVQRQGGPRYWAREFDLPFDIPGRIDGWPEERIRAELADYLQGRTTWPTAEQFRIDRRRSLRDAIKWSGGPERWGAEFEIEVPSRSRSTERWSYPRLKAELAQFVGNGSFWPTAAEFERAGKTRLHDAIDRHKARDQLASELSLRRRTRPPWTDAAIEAALDRFLEGQDRWPTTREFKRAGLGGLHCKLMKDETRDDWANRYGFLPPRRSAERKVRQGRRERRRAPAFVPVADRTDRASGSPAVEISE